MTQPTLEFSGCPWPVDPACLGAEWDALDPEVQERAVALASETLHRLTGYRVGGCPIIVRPCKKGCASGYLPGYSKAWMTPHVTTQGMWINSCGCNTDCSCTQL